MQSCDIAHQIVETVSCYFSGAVQIDTVEFLHDLGVIGNLEIRNNGLAVFLDLHVLAVIFTDRYGRIDDVRNDHHSGQDSCLQLFFLCFQLRKSLCICIDLFLHRHGFFFLTLAHQFTDFFGNLISVGAQIICFFLCSSALCIQLDYFIYQRKLFILEFFPDIFFYHFRIFSYKFNIDHDSSSLKSNRHIQRFSFFFTKGDFTFAVFDFLRVGIAAVTAVYGI